MKTKELIKEKALELFNRFGLSNTTLRHVAKELDKSYGNITYHFKNKEVLVTELYFDYKKRIAALEVEDTANPDFILFNLTKYSYKISIQYLFFFLDYIELKRNFPVLIRQADKDNAIRMKQYFKLLAFYREKGILKSSLKDSSLNYLMELSGALRTFYFQKNYNKDTTEVEYTEYLNALLYPYLSNKGRSLLQKWELNTINI